MTQEPRPARNEDPHGTVAINPAQKHVIRRLRRIIPKQDEPISWIGTQRIAMKQATLLARLARQANADIVQFISTLPVVRIVRDANLPNTSASYWDENANQWIIVLGTGNALAQRRVCVLLEFKRIIDHGHEHRLYDARYLYGHVQAELAAELFTGAALMPTRDVRAASHVIGATPAALARMFSVPVDYAVARLSDLNLLPPSTEAPEGGTNDRTDPHDIKRDRR